MTHRLNQNYVWLILWLIVSAHTMEHDIQPSVEKQHSSSEEINIPIVFTTVI